MPVAIGVVNKFDRVMISLFASPLGVLDVEKAFTARRRRIC